MKWHANERINDGVMRHPTNSPAWQTFDHLHLNFAKDPRNIRLGLSAGGLNPFRSKNNSHSTWPVTLMSYNAAWRVHETIILHVIYTYTWT